MDALAVLIVAGEWTGLARGVIGAPLYAGALDLILIGLVGLASFRWFRSGERRLPLLAWLLVAYVAFALVELFNPNVPGLITGLEGFRKSAFTMIAFFAVFFSESTESVRFYKIIAIGSMPAFAWAIRQFFVPLPAELNIIGTSGTSIISFHSGPVLRAFSPMAGPFHLGLMAAFVMVIAIVLSGRGSRWWIGVAALAGVALGLTITRANIASGVLAAIVVVTSGSGIRSRLAPATAAGVVGAVAAVLFAVGAISLPLVHVPPSAARLETASPTVPVAPSGRTAPPSATATPDTIGDVVQGITNPLQDKSLNFRFGYWRNYINAIAQRPLIGYGTSSAADGFDDIYSNAGRRNFEPHSMYLKPALEMGLGGLSLFLSIGVVTLFIAVRSVLAGLLLGRIAIGMLTALAITGLTGPMLDAYPVNVLVWATAGWLALNIPLKASEAPPSPSLERP